MKKAKDLYEELIAIAYELEDELCYDETPLGREWGELVNKLQQFSFDRQYVWDNKEAEDDIDYLITSYNGNLIKYNKGTLEAVVPIEEIKPVISLDDYKRLLGYTVNSSIVDIQENENVSDYSLIEFGYFLSEICSSYCFVDFGGEVRICEIP